MRLLSHLVKSPIERQGGLYKVDWTVFARVVFSAVACNRVFFGTANIPSYLPDRLFDGRYELH